MLNPADNYFFQKEEPLRSCLQALRDHILRYNIHITEAWMYGMPFYCYKRKRFCYLWVHKKIKQPYIGIVDGIKINHPDLLVEKRVRMKILLIGPGMNIPVRNINSILSHLIS
jgi:hypothetical protein